VTKENEVGVCFKAFPHTRKKSKKKKLFFSDGFP